MHILILQYNFAHEVIKKELRIINLKGLFICSATLKDIANFKHEKEIRRIESTLLIFNFS